MPYQEDRWRYAAAAALHHNAGAAAARQLSLSTIHCFGVFDGHGGHAVSTLLEGALPGAVGRAFSAAPLETPKRSHPQVRSRCFC